MRWLGMALVVLVGIGGWSRGAHAQQDDRCIHTVAAGQTIGHIAYAHGVSAQDLIDSDAALRKNPDLLRVGQTLNICAAKTLAKRRVDHASNSSSAKPKGRRCGAGGHIVSHRVVSGDTLSKIIGRYGVTDREIFRYNKSVAKPPHMLQVGQSIEICVDQRQPHGGRAPKSKLCGLRTPLYHHEVVPGENLGQIAGRYGVRRHDLLRWNSRLRDNPDLLSVGQDIRVCPEIAPRKRTKIMYTVKSGDNFGEIAMRYDLSPGELKRFQRGALADPGSLRVGQTLVVWADGGIVPGFGGIDTDKGVLKAGVQMPPGRHYTLKWTAGAWGTSHTIRAIQAGIADYKARLPGGPDVYIGDISRRGGGPFKPHRSHQHGRDVDIAYVTKGGDGKTRFRAANAKTLDVARTWRLLMSLINTGQVVYIFVDHRIQKLLYEYAREKRGASEEFLDELFQYPRGRRRAHGIIRHWKGHVNHFHVRFRK